MNTVERIKIICKERKIPISKLEQDLNFSNAYIASLKKGTIPADRLKQIADYLNLSMEYLITGEESNEYYTAEEKNLVEQYRGTDDTGKKRIMEYVQDMRRLHPEQEREPETEAKIS